MSEEKVVEEAAPRGMHISVEQVQALNVLIAAVNVAQQKGAYSFADSQAVYDAIKKFIPEQPAEESPEEEEVGSD